MFYLIGLGLGDPMDVSIKGQKIIQQCERVYLEAYTSILLHGGKDSLESFYGRSILVADREQVEQGADNLLSGAEACDVALLVVGDPLGATTHTDLLLRAEQAAIPVTVVSNASILSAVGVTGLDVARFGEVVSIPFWDDTWKPDSFCDKIMTNLKQGLHTLCLLDIKVKEQSIENLLRNRKIYEAPRFMRTHQAAEQLLQALEGRNGLLLTPDTPCVACVRLGTDQQYNSLTTLAGLSESDFGEPLHSLVVCAPLSASERDNCSALSRYYQQESHPSSKGCLHLVGLGMQMEDITVKGMDILKRCSTTLVDERTRQILKTTWPDRKTSKVSYDKFEEKYGERLEDLFNLENVGFDPRDSDSCLQMLKKGNDVAVVVWGDPLVFTEYCSLLTYVIDEHSSFKIIHNTSLLNSVACCGLQLYTFGETVQLTVDVLDMNAEAFATVTKDQNSFVQKILQNRSNGLHTLCLLHSPKEIDTSDSNWRCATPVEAGQILMRALSVLGNVAELSLSANILVVAFAGLGSPAQQIKTCTIEKLPQQEFIAGPLYALIVLGKTHPLEDDCLQVLTDKIN